MSPRSQDELEERVRNLERKAPYRRVVRSDDLCTVCGALAFATCRPCRARGEAVGICDTICGGIHFEDEHRR